MVKLELEVSHTDTHKGVNTIFSHVVNFKNVVGLTYKSENVIVRLVFSSDELEKMALRVEQITKFACDCNAKIVK
mgnify:CR=1 FL=1